MVLNIKTLPIYVKKLWPRLRFLKNISVFTFGQNLCERWQNLWHVKKCKGPRKGSCDIHVKSVCQFCPSWGLRECRLDILSVNVSFVIASWDDLWHQKLSLHDGSMKDTKTCPNGLEKATRLFTMLWSHRVTLQYYWDWITKSAETVEFL